MSQARTTEILENSMVKGGIEIVTDTVERTGNYVGIIVTSDATITTLTPKVALPAASNAFTDLTNLPIGQYPIEFTVIELATGEALLVKG
jgi:hypothetical protein